MTSGYTMTRVKCKHCNKVKVESVSWVQYLNGFFDKAPKHVRPDMWPAYLKVINQKVPYANHVLYPFHVLYKT